MASPSSALTFIFVVVQPACRRRGVPSPSLSSRLAARLFWGCPFLRCAKRPKGDDAGRKGPKGRGRSGRRRARADPAREGAGVTRCALASLKHPSAFPLPPRPSPLPPTRAPHPYTLPKYTVLLKQMLALTTSSPYLHPNAHINESHLDICGFF